MIVTMGQIPRIRLPGFHFRQRLFLYCSILLVFILLPASGCRQKSIRIAVPQEDLAKANSMALDGDAAFVRKDFYAALIKYLEASRINPNDELIWNRVGISYSQLKYYDEAITSFKRSIQLNSKYANSVNNLGSALFARRELKKAEKYYKKAIHMNSKEATFHMNLGSLYFEKKKINEALAEWRKGLDLNSDVLSKNNTISLSIAGENTFSKDKAFAFARIFALAGNAPKAIDFLEQALKDGFSDLSAIQKHPDFDRIRDDERFIKFLQDALFWISRKQN
jgi:tetratricopeptide (TPR) repeat protein